MSEKLKSLPSRDVERITTETLEFFSKCSTDGLEKRLELLGENFDLFLERLAQVEVSENENLQKVIDKIENMRFPTLSEEEIAKKVKVNVSTEQVKVVTEQVDLSKITNSLSGLSEKLDKLEIEVVEVEKQVLVEVPKVVEVEKQVVVEVPTVVEVEKQVLVEIPKTVVRTKRVEIPTPVPVTDLPNKYMVYFFLFMVGWFEILRWFN